MMERLELAQIAAEEALLAPVARHPIAQKFLAGLRVRREAEEAGLGNHLVAFTNVKVAIAVLLLNIDQFQDEAQPANALPEWAYLSDELGHLAWLAERIDDALDSAMPWAWRQHAEKELRDMELASDDDQDDDDRDDDDEADAPTITTGRNEQ